MMRARLLIAVLWAWGGAALAEEPAPEPAPAQPIAEPAYIEPQNALEQSFVAAVDNPELRAAFRRQFLEADVALALSSRDPSAPPREINLPNGAKACLIFTSPARAAAVMGDDSPYVVLTGREALMLVRGTNVIINVNLRPYLTLDSEAIEGFLTIPEAPAEPPTQAQAPALEEASAGPTQ